MASLHIDDLPDEVHRILAARAETQGRDLADLVRELLVGEARRHGDKALLERLDDRPDRTDSSGLFSDQVTQVVRQARASSGTDGGASAYSWSTP